MCGPECTNGGLSHVFEGSNFEDFGIRLFLLGAIKTLEQDNLGIMNHQEDLLGSI
jgi:hypothetical protein